MLTYEAIEQIANIVAPLGTFTTVEAEPEFAKKVRSGAVILKANNPISYEDIRRAAAGFYYRVALRIAAAKFPSIITLVKNTDGSETLNSDLETKKWQWVENDIVAMLTPGGTANSSALTETRLGAFSGGIEFAVANLVSAHLIRNIPLNSSSLKFVDIANNLEAQANEDIERIIKISDTGSSSSSLNGDSSASTKNNAVLCIAHSLDSNTILESSFNTPDINSTPATYLNIVSLENVETVNTLTVNLDEVGICYFYMTGQSIHADQNLITNKNYLDVAGSPQNSGSVSYKIEKAFSLIGASDNPSTLNIDELITILADEINSETLEVVGSKVANILTAPQRGKPKFENQTIIKQELYPNTLSLKNRKAYFNLYHRINKLNFDVRRYSNLVTTEVLTIAFYTVPLADWNNYLLNPTLLSLRTLRSSSLLGINGLIFGSANSYSDLGNKVPYSALLSVEKGTATAVSITADKVGGSSDSVNNVSNSDASNIIDTFYFACTNPATSNPFIENLVLRVSSATYSMATPLDIIVDLTIVPFTDPNLIDNLSIGEQVANRVVDAIYEYTRVSNLNSNLDSSNILGILLGDYQKVTTIINTSTNSAVEVPLEEYIDDASQPNFTGIQNNNSYIKDNIAGRVQIVAFRYKDNEYRLVVDLISVPSNLWVGTGNFILRKTQWAEGRKRSITVETKVLTSTNSNMETKSQELNSVKASVSKIEASKSKLLQSVFDKRDFLLNGHTGSTHKW